jgi:hypothetical protein
VPSTAVWLMALAAPLAASSPGWRWLLAAGVPFEVFLLGTFPLGTLDTRTVMTPLSLVGALLMVALCGGVLWRGLRSARAVAVDGGAAGAAVDLRRAA